MTDTIKINILVTLYKIMERTLSWNDFEVKMMMERGVDNYLLVPSTTFAEIKNKVIIDSGVVTWGHRRDTVKRIDLDYVTNGNPTDRNPERFYTHSLSTRAPLFDESLVSNILRDGDTLRANVFVRDPDRYLVNFDAGYHGVLGGIWKGTVYVKADAPLCDLRDAIIDGGNGYSRSVYKDARRLRLTHQGEKVLRPGDSVRDLGDDAVVTIEVLDEVPAEECDDKELPGRLTETITRHMIRYAGTHPRQGPRLLAEVNTYHDMEIILTLGDPPVDLHRRLALSTILLLSAEVGEGSLVELLIRNRGKYLDTAGDVGVGVGLRLRVSLSDPPFDIYDPNMNIRALDTLIDYCYTAHISPTVFAERDLTCLTTWADYMGFRSLKSHLETVQNDDVIREVWRRKVEISSQ